MKKLIYSICVLLFLTTKGFCIEQYYLSDQHLRTTDSVTFAGVTASTTTLSSATVTNITVITGINLPDDSIQPADIGAGSLDTDVIVSSVAGSIVTPLNMDDGDHGDYTYTSGVAVLDGDVVDNTNIVACTLDTDVIISSVAESIITPTNIKNGDHGDFTYTSNVAALDTDVVDNTNIVACTLDADVVISSVAGGIISPTNIEDGACLTEIADDDGSGSGLDADLLDGRNYDAFLSTWAAGDTMAGALVLESTLDVSGGDITLENDSLIHNGTPGGMTFKDQNAVALMTLSGEGTATIPYGLGAATGAFSGAVDIGGILTANTLSDSGGTGVTVSTNVTITGKLIVSGDIDLNTSYAGVKGSTNVATNVATNVYRTIIANWSSDSLQNFTLSGATLTYTDATTHVFAIRADMAFHSTAATDIYFKWYKNGVAVDLPNPHREVPQNDVGMGAISCAVSLAQGDVIALYITTDDGDDPIMDTIYIIADEID